MSRFARSWALIKASAEVLRQDKELMIFPLLSAISAILVLATFVLPLIAAGAFAEVKGTDNAQALFVVVGFLFYLVQYFVIFFFNAALVGAALIRLEGGDPTVGDGLRIAASKFSSILAYAAIAATVGLILRMIEERAGFVGRWIAGLLGVAFTVATFLVVPLLVTRDIGAVDAVKESATLLKKSWGENIIGNGGLGLAFFLIYLAVALAAAGIFALAVSTHTSALILFVFGLAVVAFMVVALIHAALQGVYSAALCRYVTTGEGGSTFDGELMEGAFRVKS